MIWSACRAGSRSAATVAMRAAITVAQMAVAETHVVIVVKVGINTTKAAMRRRAVVMMTGAVRMVAHPMANAQPRTTARLTATVRGMKAAMTIAPSIVLVGSVSRMVRRMRVGRLAAARKRAAHA